MVLGDCDRKPRERCTGRGVRRVMRHQSGFSSFLSRTEAGRDRGKI